MFDDPKKQLKALDDALHALDEPTDEDLWEEDFAEEEDFGPGKNEAVDFARTIYADEDTDVFAAEPLTKRELRKLKKQEKLQHKQEKKQKKKQKKKEKRQLHRLILIAGLEIAAILALLRWWLQWLT